MEELLSDIKIKVELNNLLQIWTSKRYNSDKRGRNINLDLFLNFKELHLHSCDLTHLPDSICKLKNLRSLNLNRNKLTFLPNSLIYLTKLKNVDIRHNNISNEEIYRISALMPWCEFYVG